MSSRVERIPRELLFLLHTKTLLQRRKDLLACEEAVSWPPGAHEQRKLEFEQADFIEYKDTEIWKRAYNELLEVLSHREHVPTGNERKQTRIDRAKQQKSKEKKRRT